MRGDNIQSRWRKTRGKKGAHWGILTLDDLPKANEKYSQLITQLKARYQAAKELSEAKPANKSEDLSI